MLITRLLQKWWGHWLRTCHNGKWCGEKLSTLFLEKLFFSGKFRLIFLLLVTEKESERHYRDRFSEEDCRDRSSSVFTRNLTYGVCFRFGNFTWKPQLLSTFSGFFVERSWFPTVCNWLISGAILFDICSFATMIDSTGAFSCIDLIKSHSSKKKKKNYSGDLCERKVKRLKYFSSKVCSLGGASWS